MIRSRLMCIALIITSFAIAAAAFRDTSEAQVGTVSSAQPMLEPRSGHTATLLPNGKVLIAGGMRRNQDFYKSAELYDPPSGRFFATGEMSLGRVGQIAVLLGSGKVLVAGGWVGHACTDSAELYDPSTGKFTLLAARMATRRGGARATILPNGDVLITGGADHDSPGGIVSAELFRVSDMSFHAVSPMHFARLSHTATLLRDGRVLVVGGRGDKVNTVAEIFDPKTQRFAETGSLATARYKHTAGLLPDGRVLVAGGSDERDWSGNLNSAEIYDPRTGKFSHAPSLISARFKLPEQAVAMQSGELLIAGGSSKVELFDSGAGKFVVASGEIGGPWHFMSETRLQDGRVLLAGGYANNDRATAQAWIYKP
jgi:Kelch motif/Galactose oxidase, central domain